MRLGHREQKWAQTMRRASELGLERTLGHNDTSPIALEDGTIDGSSRTNSRAELKLAR
jgi:hypothetical protein